MMLRTNVLLTMSSLTHWLSAYQRVISAGVNSNIIIAMNDKKDNRTCGCIMEIIVIEYNVVILILGDEDEKTCNLYIFQ